MPADSSQGESTYIFDAENAAEMARLALQARHLTKSMGGLFPEQTDLSQIHDILDIACGPGGWVFDVAYAYPKIQVVGIDISKLMIEYAKAQAQMERLGNAEFRVMDTLKPLDFSDSSFDLVNARLLVGFMPSRVWPKLIEECMRITRPGGVIRLTECDGWGITNSLACEKMNAMSARAAQLAGLGFSPDGRTLGLTPMMGRLLSNAGYQNIQKKVHVIDFSAGAESHASIYQNFMVSFKLMQPFLIKMGVITQEEVDRIYQQALSEMLSDDFCGLAYFLTVWGQKA